MNNLPNEVPRKASAVEEISSRLSSHMERIRGIESRLNSVLNGLRGPVPVAVEDKASKPQNNGAIHAIRNYCEQIESSTDHINSMLNELDGLC